MTAYLHICIDYFALNISVRDIFLMLMINIHYASVQLLTSMTELSQSIKLVEFNKFIL